MTRYREKTRKNQAVEPVSDYRLPVNGCLKASINKHLAVIGNGLFLTGDNLA
ncbi:MAG: hypothetical protein ACFFD4_29325 [Candidatus Odinarchaeota archaeon]